MKLVLGGFGFLGSCIAGELNNNDIPARIVDKFSGGVFRDSKSLSNVIIGDINDKYLLRKTLDGVDTVLYFISQSYPSMNHPSLQFEIENSLRTLDLTLSAMRDMNIKNIIFPSSGGTVYGEVADGLADEDFSLQPQSAYGAGKLLCEDIIKYYCRVYGMNAQILRLSNVYGCPFFRKVQQGAVDIFIQKALSGEVIELWGDPSALIRDYIYVDDFCSAVLSLLDKDIKGIETFNVASGVGHSLQDVLNFIEKSLGKQIEIVVRSDSYSGVKRSVLSTDRIFTQTGWTPKYSLEAGIKRTIEKKKEHL